MADPPFNVDEVDTEKVKNDPRLRYALPGVNKDVGSRRRTIRSLEAVTTSSNTKPGCSSTLVRTEWRQYSFATCSMVSFLLGAGWIQLKSPM